MGNIVVIYMCKLMTGKRLKIAVAKKLPIITRL